MIATILQIYWRVRLRKGRRQRSQGQEENEKGPSWQGEPEMMRPVDWERLLSH